MKFSIGLSRILILVGYISLFAAIMLSLNIDAPLFALVPTLFTEREVLYGFDTVFAFLLVFLLVLFLPTGFKKPSDLILHVQYVFPILPMLAFFLKYDLPSIYFYSIVLAFVLMLLLVSFDPPSLRVGKKGFSYLFFLRFFSCLATLVLLYVIAMGGGSYFNLNFWRVYEYRQAAADNLPPLAGYFISIITKVILPVIAVFGIVSNKRAYTLYALMLGVLMFGLTAHKAVLFYPLFAVLLYYFFQRQGVWFILVLASGAAVIVFGYWADVLPEALFILFFDRLLLIPAAINFMFFDWFSKSGNFLVFWSDSKISLGLISYPYELSVPFLIGQEYFNDPLAGANTGWLGSGYANAGIAGVVFYGLVMGLILAVLNACSRRLGGALVVAVSSGALLAPMLSSDLPNAFLTHGLLVVILVLLSVKDAPSNGARKFANDL